MMMIDVIPQEFFDGVSVPPAVTLDGELLGALDEAPAGAWLAQMIEGVDVAALATLELATYLRQCARAQAWTASCLDTAVAELASRRDPDLAADAEVSLGPASQVRAERCDIDHFTEWPDGRTVETNLGPFDRPWHLRKTRGSLSVTVDHSGAVTVTTILGQTRTLTPYDYSAHLEPARTTQQDAERPPF